MEKDRHESRHGRHNDRDDMDDSPRRQHWDGGVYDEDIGVEKSKHSSRERDKKRSIKGDERDREHRSKDRERSKKSGDDVLKDLEREGDRECSKDRSKDSKGKDKEHDWEKSREKERERDKDRKDRAKEKDRDRERESEKTKEKSREREKERERVKEKEREKDREKHKDREKEKEQDREKGREKTKERERDADKDKERTRERDKVGKIRRGDDHDGSKDDVVPIDEDDWDEVAKKQGKYSVHGEGKQDAEGKTGRSEISSSELEDRILKMKEGRLKKKPEADSEVLSWVNKSRKLQEKRNAEKERAKQLSKIFEEQDNIVQGESEDEDASRHTTHDLAGVKVLHGLDKVMEGGAVVLTLKDQNLLADGDINEEIDMLENVEIGEQKRRNEAYKAAKKKTGIYDDKFNDDPTMEKKMLPQYDDSTVDEGVTLDERGRFTGEAEKKLEELRKRLQSTSSNNHFEDLTSSAKMISDYYTSEEMLQFKKPKKKKALRKKEKLDLNALEAEAVSAGLGVGDLGSRNDGRRHAIRQEQERSEAEMRKSAYKSAYAKADEASKSLRLEQTLPVKTEEDENPVFADDDEDLYKSLERARKLALKKQEPEASGIETIARLATTPANSQPTEDQNPETEEPQENKIVFTEMEEFVWGLQLDQETYKPEREDVFNEEDETQGASDQEKTDVPGGWTEVNHTEDEISATKDHKDEVVPDEIIHEVAVGKGLSGALKLLKERGTLKESVEWGGRNMDKKKSKLVGLVDDEADNNNRFKDLRIERTDEYGRIMTPKEAFRMISHKFHGKGPGKMKQEKRMKQYLEELKLKQMKNSDTPSLSVERMRDAQAQLKTPYLVLSGHVKSGEGSDPSSGFGAVEKDLLGGLTPMLGDKKVEHFLGIKRKAESGKSSTPKKPKT